MSEFQQPRTENTEMMPIAKQTKMTQDLDSDLFPGQIGTMGLYKNNVNPGPYDDFAGVIVECDFPGYAAQPVNTDQFGTDPASGQVVWPFTPTAAFFCNADPTPPQTVYGCFVKTTAGAFVAAQLLSSPQTVARNGDIVWPKLNLLLQLDCWK